jgi:hypothetical protein
MKSSHTWKQTGRTIPGTGLIEVVDTNEAAAAINRAPQTLRKWACLENGPIRPVRIHGRLAWRVSDLQSLLNGNKVDTARGVET